MAHGPQAAHRDGGQAPGQALEVRLRRSSHTPLPCHASSRFATSLLRRRWDLPAERGAAARAAAAGKGGRRGRSGRAAAASVAAAGEGGSARRASWCLPNTPVDRVLIRGCSFRFSGPRAKRNYFEKSETRWLQFQPSQTRNDSTSECWSRSSTASTKPLQQLALHQGHTNDENGGARAISAAACAQGACCGHAVLDDARPRRERHA